MRINTLIKNLEKFKKEHGNIEVSLDLENIIENSDHGEYTHEPYLTLKVEMISTMSMDTCKVSKPKTNVVIRVRE